MTKSARTQKLASLDAPASSDILDSSLDLDDPNAESFVAGVQGNILKFHRRLHGVAFFVHFRSQPEVVRRRVGELARLYVKSGSDRVPPAEEPKNNIHGGQGGPAEIKDGTFGMMALSFEGYKALRLTRYIPGYWSAAGEPPKDGAPAEPRLRFFTDGMGNLPQDGQKSPNYSYYGISWDPRTDLWADEYKDARRRVHLFVLLADDDKKRLDGKVDEIKKALGEFSMILAVERLSCRVHPDISEQIEHFGFKDGVSGPKFVKQQVASPRPEGWFDLSPEYPLNRIFVQEPTLFPQSTTQAASTGAQELEPAYSGLSYGSFLVALKLEQNVWAFRHACQELARELGLPDDDVEAMVVGRRKDGSPLVSEMNVPTAAGLAALSAGGDPAAGAANGAGEPLYSLEHVGDPNDFNYSADRKGLQCPVHAHIRQVNTRFQGIKGDEDSKKMRVVIARRGMVYGPPREDLLSGSAQKPPSEGVGLFFMSFQSDLTSFVALQQATQTANRVGIDPLTGLLPRIASLTLPAGDPGYGAQTWTSRTGTKVTRRLGNFVTPKGGEFLFAPSIHFLRQMNALTPDDGHVPGETPTDGVFSKPQPPEHRKSARRVSKRRPA